MLTRNEILRLKSLHTPKGRKLNNSVLIEGFRLVNDCLESKWTVDNVFITKSSFDKPQYKYTKKPSIRRLFRILIISLLANSFGVKVKKILKNANFADSLIFVVSGIRPDSK